MIAASRRAGFGSMLDRLPASLGSHAGALALAGSFTVAVLVVLVGPSITILLGLGVVVALVAAFMPGVLLAIFMLSGIYKAAIQPSSPVDITLVLAGLCALQVVPVLRRREPLRISWIGLALMTAVGVLYLLGVLYAPNQETALRFAATYWVFVLFAEVPAALRVGSEPRYLRQFLWSLFALGIPMVIFGLPLVSDSQRLTEFGASTIEVSRAALLVPLVGVTFVLHERGLLLRALTLLLIPAAIVVAIASGSRGPLFALAIIAALGLARVLVRPRSVDWRAVSVIAALVVASVVVLSVVGGSLPDVATSRFALFGDFVTRVLNGDLDSTMADTSSGRRVALFGLAFSMFQDRPILGFGTGGFATLMPWYLGPPYESWPHNAVLQFAAEFGIIGVALFGSLVVLAFVRWLPPGSLGSAVRIAFLFFLLNAMVSDDIYGSRPTWGLLALVLLIDVPQRLADVRAPMRVPAPTPALSASTGGGIAAALTTAGTGRIRGVGMGHPRLATADRERRYRGHVPPSTAHSRPPVPGGRPGSP